MVSSLKLVCKISVPIFLELGKPRHRASSLPEVTEVACSRTRNRIGIVGWQSVPPFSDALFVVPGRLPWLGHLTIVPAFALMACSHAGFELIYSFLHKLE